ncbi:MAG: EAL domain-containing protein [Rhodospirillales bacterium]|nr:EAL domain-containing protein [Rhodospirillales bacterium]
MKKHQPIIVRGNQKGKGFHLFKAPAEEHALTVMKRKVMIAGTAATLGVFVLLLAVGQHATLDFTLLVTGLVALCSMISYDVISRRVWEKKLSLKLDRLCENHDRLVREVARNRGDIAVIKEGLGQMAHSVEEQGRHLSPTDTVEGRMIETMVTRLGALGDMPRTEATDKHAEDVMKLEMTPPPARPAPLSELDDEMAPDFEQYSDDVVAELIRHAVRNDRIDVFLQPIAGLPHRRPRMYEAYARIRAAGGVYLPASRFMTMAKKEELVPAIDNHLLLRTLEILRDRRNSEGDTPYVLNISSQTLSDRGFMNDLVSFLSQNHKMAGRLIFELPQKELEENNETLSPILDGLSKLGCRFSMDRVRSRVININLMKSMHIRFIKMDAEWLIKEGGSNSGFSRIIRMKKQLDQAGIDLVAERIEAEDTLRELLDFNVDYGQGYLFGKPDHYAAYRVAA